MSLSRGTERKLWTRKDLVQFLLRWNIETVIKWWVLWWNFLPQNLIPNKNDFFHLQTSKNPNSHAKTAKKTFQISIKLMSNNSSPIWLSSFFLRWMQTTDDLEFFINCFPVNNSRKSLIKVIAILNCTWQLCVLWCVLSYDRPMSSIKMLIY